MVESLGWLSHSSSQAAELLEQTNAVIRRLLASGQLELAARAANMVPKDTVARYCIRSVLWTQNILSWDPNPEICPNNMDLDSGPNLDPDPSLFNQFHDQF